VQLEAVDEALKNGLWSVLKVHVWDRAYFTSGMYGGYFLSSASNRDLKVLCDRLWFHFFKKPLDELDTDWTKVLKQLRHFFFSCQWYEVYDFVEFVADNYRDDQFTRSFQEACNEVLQREVSAYRFVDGLVAPVTDHEQLDEIERALQRAARPVQTHLRRALELLSDRQAPDYRNSIKKSISAVEALVSKIVGTEKGTLGQLLKTLEVRVPARGGNSVRPAA
jgi:hypothetical protein